MQEKGVFIMLEVRKVKRSMPDYDKVVDLLAFYDGDEFIGIN